MNGIELWQTKKEVNIMADIVRRTKSQALLLLSGVILIGLSGAGQSFGAAAAGLTRTHSGGGVTVKVSYLNPGGPEGPRFQVVLDTHSVDLDAFDLKNLTFLRDEAGKDYQPTQMENKGAGHHREVTLAFPKSASGAKRLELVIKNIAGVKERSFRWELKGKEKL
ncbi:MAG: hypothetical protein A3G94_03835 [Deltaproteobacteria bacterium RIFCSPLOWO2_12_FULL_60_16]|nr:MAG: hypothetical protein A3G94_03835 [Deltaproteobacteria bacterium RIFCSPLOWO2_12_FULL_60_16]